MSHNTHALGTTFLFQIVPSQTPPFSIAENHGRSKRDHFEPPMFLGGPKTSYLRRRCSPECQKRTWESFPEPWRHTRFHFGSPTNFGTAFGGVLTFARLLDDQMKSFYDNFHSLRLHNHRLSDGFRRDDSSNEWAAVNSISGLLFKGRDLSGGRFGGV